MRLSDTHFLQAWSEAGNEFDSWKNTPTTPTCLIKRNDLGALRSRLHFGNRFRFLFVFAALTALRSICKEQQLPPTQHPPMPTPHNPTTTIPAVNQHTCPHMTVTSHIARACMHVTTGTCMHAWNQSKQTATPLARSGAVGGAFSDYFDRDRDVNRYEM